MNLAYGSYRKSRGKFFNIEFKADLYIFLRQIIFVNQNLPYLIDWIVIFTFFGVMILEQKVVVTVLDDRLGVTLYLVHYTEDLRDLDVERQLCTEEDVAVGMGGLSF